MDAAQWPGAVAVSGGGDSLALMHLLAAWAGKRAAPVVLIVDHGLRDGSAKDARKAASWARALGLRPHVLTWAGKKPDADIESAARDARYRLMGDWCGKHGVRFLYLAHTLEDQAETFLLRLARGSGLDGLSAMRSPAPYPLPGYRDLQLVRPLLGASRASLRAFLKARKQDWIDDPMNADPRFARVQLRQAAPLLAELGLVPERLALAACHLARARAALDAVTASWLRTVARVEPGRAVIDGKAFAEVPEEIGLRALAHVLGQVSEQAYRPRFARLSRLFVSIKAGMTAACTLHGCRIGPASGHDASFGRGTLTILREPGRKAGP